MDAPSLTTMLYTTVSLYPMRTLVHHLLARVAYLSEPTGGTGEHSLTPPARAADRSAPDTPDAETLFREHHRRVYAYVRYRIADLEEAEDLTSEILERALTHLASYDPRKGAFSTWLFRIAHNTTVNHWKRQQRRNRYHVELDEGLEDLAADEPSPEQVVLRREQIARMLECMRTLSPRQQEILSLRFAGQLTNREIARVLRMNERTVSVNILRALRKLRQQLAESEA